MARLQKIAYRGTETQRKAKASRKDRKKEQRNAKIKSRHCREDGNPPPKSNTMMLTIFDAEQ